jgi:tetratricopeptide (TPR) repeat protein
MADNWYLVLGLEFDPPVVDERLIKEQIEKKKRDWSRDLNDSENGSDYHRYLDAANALEIEAAMCNFETRQELIDDARKRIYEPIDGWLKMLANPDSGEISIENISKTAKKYKVDKKIVERRAHEIGVGISRELSDQELEAVYKKYYKTEPQNFNAYESFEHLLKGSTLYDFLGKGAALWSYDKLHKCAKEKRKEFINKHNEIAARGKSLCDACADAFKDDLNKNAYDCYLEYKKSRAILNEVKEIAGMSAGKLSATNWGNFIDALKKVFIDETLPADLLFAFCKIEGIAAERPKDSGNRAGYNKEECERSASFQKWYDKAKEHLKSKEFDLARTAVKEALSFFDRNSENPEFYNVAAAVYRGNQDYSAALDYINKAILYAPDNCIYYWEKFNVLYQEEAGLRANPFSDKPQRIDKIVEDEISVLEITAKKAEGYGDQNTLASAYDMLASIWYYTNPNVAVAESYAQKALKIDPSRPNAKRVMRDIAAAADQKAREDAQKAKAAEARKAHEEAEKKRLEAERKAIDDAEKEQRRLGEVRTHNAKVSQEITLIDQEIKRVSGSLPKSFSRIINIVSGIGLCIISFYLTFFSIGSTTFSLNEGMRELRGLITDPNVNDWGGFLIILLMFAYGLRLALPKRGSRKNKGQLNVLLRRRNELQRSFRR